MQRKHGWLYQNFSYVLGGCLTFTACALSANTNVDAPMPASPQACTGLSLDSERLSCYDSIFKVEPAEALVSERRAAQEIASTIQLETPAEPKTTREKLKEFVDDFELVGQAPAFDPNVSLLDRRWELSSNSKLGTWNIRAYKPVYLLPAIWTSNKNESPQSPNPINTVTEPQDLKSTEAKFQLSFKTKAMENVIGDFTDLWIGYTQSSRWQVYNSEASRPFRETNYEPEISLIARTNYELLGLNARLLGVTFNHQSNGRSDPLSRSWNRIIFNAGFERDNFALMFRPWVRISEEFEDDNNPDIKNYMGRGDLTAFYRWNRHEFSLMMRHSLKEGDDSRASVQFDWAFPITSKLRGHFQVFDGYGESLIDYNHRATYLGLGVSLMNWY